MPETIPHSLSILYNPFTKIFSIHLIMNFELIVASDKNGVIGNNNTIPWHIPEDLKHFRQLTINNIVVMGRKTFESLPNGPLKDRINIVITQNPHQYKNTDSVIYANMENIFDIIKHNQANKKVFIIGGSEIYNLFFNYCSIIHLTRVDIESQGNIIFNIDTQSLSLIDKTDIMFSKNNSIPFQYFTYSSETSQ
jgi:dihydrofolate reductase